MLVNIYLWLLYSHCFLINTWRPQLLLAKLCNIIFLGFFWIYVYFFLLLSIFHFSYLYHRYSLVQLLNHTIDRGLVAFKKLCAWNLFTERSCLEFLSLRFLDLLLLLIQLKLLDFLLINRLIEWNCDRTLRIQLHGLFEFWNCLLSDAPTHSTFSLSLTLSNKFKRICRIPKAHSSSFFIQFQVWGSEKKSNSSEKTAIITILANILMHPSYLLHLSSIFFLIMFLKYLFPLKLKSAENIPQH